MTDKLRDAAQAIVDRWDSPAWGGSAENLRHTGEYIAELRAALAQQAAQAVPPGWKLVPVEPTPEMRKAAADAWIDCGDRLILNKAATALRAGIAAAPTPPAVKESLTDQTDDDSELAQQDAQAVPQVARVPYTGDVVRIMREAGMTFHLGLPHKAVVEQMTRVVDLVYSEASIKSAQKFAAEPTTVIPEALVKWASSPGLVETGNDWKQGYEHARAWVHVQLSLNNAAPAQPAPKPLGWLDRKAVECLQGAELNWMPAWNRPTSADPVPVFLGPPAQRVMLTDDEIDVLWAKQQAKPFKTHGEDRMAFARAVIEAYEIKNGLKP